MDGESIIALVILGIVAFIMMGIGFGQRNSRTPVGFYSGEVPPKAEELTDVSEWNRRHGNIWIGYGIVMLLSAVLGMPLNHPLLSPALILGGVVVPLPLMVLCHRHLVKVLKRDAEA